MANAAQTLVDPLQPRRQAYVWLACSAVTRDKRFILGRSIVLVRGAETPVIPLPDDQELVHAIPTNDPEGLEAYWRKRFGIRRGKSEWFRPNGRDVGAFKAS